MKVTENDDLNHLLQVLDADYQDSGSRGIWFFTGLKTPSREKRKSTPYDAKSENELIDPKSSNQSFKKLCARSTQSPGPDLGDQSEDCTNVSPDTHAEETPGLVFEASLLPRPSRSPETLAVHSEYYLTDCSEVGYWKLSSWTTL